jgi:hypothetical protein
MELDDREYWSKWHRPVSPKDTKAEISTLRKQLAGMKQRVAALERRIARLEQ